jgi:transposase
MAEVMDGSPRLEQPRSEVMRVPDEVAAMLHLHRLGWSLRRIAREVGCSPMTVQRYIAAEGWVPFRSSPRSGALSGLEDWLAERFRQHRGNADVLRQELLAEHGIAISLRTVERAVASLRRELQAEARATVRFETPPGQQLQIDFGERQVRIGAESVRAYLFVATLGYSRRLFVRVFRHERQGSWFAGIEDAFRHFGGRPAELLLDNARALVERHDMQSREVVFNERFQAFVRYWDVRPVACAPYRARTKGKDERGVGYVKRNAIAGRSFASWAELEAHLAQWTREVADVRVHGTTGEAPLVRFERDEAAALRPLGDKPRFGQLRELTRRVQNDGCVDVDTNHYSVPWQLIGAGVSVVVCGSEVRILHAGTEVARHAQRLGRRERAVMAAHLRGIAISAGPADGISAEPPQPAPLPGELLRPLAEYEQVAGGDW